MPCSAHKAHCVAQPTVWQARGAQRLAMLVVAGLVALVACAKGAADTAEPSCNEELLASGRGLPVASGLSLAVSYQIEVTHPELGRVIAAAADYERAHPQYQDLSNPDYDDDLIGDGDAGYIGALLVLSERPDLATPEILDALEQAAAEGGIAEVGNTVRHARPGDPPPLGSVRFSEFQGLVRERRIAVEDSELVPLPAPGCRDVDGER
jgi:hypothetical protein